MKIRFTVGREGPRPTALVTSKLLLASAALILASGAAVAHPQQFHTTFTALNKNAPLNKVGLNPSASAQVTYNHDDDSLHVVIMGTGFEPGIPHVAHIHGNLVNPMTTGSGALDSKTPTLAQDADGDGFIELFEGLTTYGPILFDFMNIDADMNGTIDYDMTFNLRDPNAPFGFINPLDPSQGKYGITDLVGLTFAFQLLVPGHLAGRFLHLTAYVLGSTFDSISIRHDPSPSTSGTRSMDERRAMFRSD